MNRISSTCFQTALSATLSRTLVGTNFTGKEKDSESGYHYFGARYYDSEALSGWLSVDPMADKYPSLSPYNYCAWNPVKLVDPDGMCADKPPTSLIYTIKKGDNFWQLEKRWNLPHGTLQSINPNVDPNNLQVGQEVNAAIMDGNLIIVGNSVSIPQSREFEVPTEEGSFGIVSMASSDNFLQLRMAFDALLPNLGTFFFRQFPSNRKVVNKVILTKYIMDIRAES